MPIAIGPVAQGVAWLLGGGLVVLGLREVNSTTATLSKVAYVAAGAFVLYVAAKSAKVI